MTLVEDLLEQDRIKDYRVSHQGAEKQIVQAAHYMQDEHWKNDEALTALLKILPALTEKVLRIFFSYKNKDEDTARQIVNILRKYSAGKLEITYMADFPTEVAGKPWRDEIRHGVEQANWFMLLLPDPREDWDWCLYETGLFERELTKADKLLCLHHPEVEMPKAIKDYQGIKTDCAGVEKLLRMIFLKDNPVPGMDAINPAILDDIPSIAVQIVNAVHPPHKDRFRRRFAPWVKLQVTGARDLTDQDGLDSARIEDINSAALKLFGRLDKPATWGELRSGIEEWERDSRWRKELLQTINGVANNLQCKPIHAVFQSGHGKTYRPLLFAIDRSGEYGPIVAYHVNFIEDVSAIDTKAFPRRMATLVTLLRLAIRFRWEVLEPFTEHVLVGDDFDNLANVLKRIEQDSESRGLLNEFSILKLFTQDDADRVNEMLISWGRLRDPENNQGELDIAIKEEDPQKVFDILNGMIEINQEFLRIAARRFLELVSGQK